MLEKWDHFFPNKFLSIWLSLFYKILCSFANLNLSPGIFKRPHSFFNKYNKTKECHSPSKLPLSEQAVRSFPYVSLEGRKTNTPELKQSGQPGSGAAESSSLSNNSSMFDKTWRQEGTPLKNPQRHHENITNSTERQHSLEYLHP